MFLIILASIVAVNAAVGPFQPAPNYYRPKSDFERNARVLRLESESNERGYRYAYDTENGIHGQESGVESNGIQAQGQYSYTGDDGQVYSVVYTADVNGFQAQGAHLPTPPPIPEAIARALARNAQDEARGVFDDGNYRQGRFNTPAVAPPALRPYQQPYSPYRN